MNNTELNWFSCVRNNIDLIEDSVIFNLDNPFENEELNTLLFYYRGNIKNYKTLRNALKASFESLSVDYPLKWIKDNPALCNGTRIKR